MCSFRVYCVLWFRFLGFGVDSFVGGVGGVSRVVFGGVFGNVFVFGFCCYFYCFYF